MTCNLLNTLKVVSIPVFAGQLASPINAGAFSMLAGLILVPIVSLFTKKPDKNEMDKLFEVFEEQVTVRRKTALPQNEE